VHVGGDSCDVLDGVVQVCLEYSIILLGENSVKSGLDVIDCTGCEDFSNLLHMVLYSDSFATVLAFDVVSQDRPIEPFSFIESNILRRVFIILGVRQNE